MKRTLCLIAALAATLEGCSSDSSSKPETKPDGVVVNEMSAAGEEWLELYNTAGDVDLAGYAITDTDKTTGQPRADKALRFPAGSKIARKSFVLVMLGKKNATPGPYSPQACLPGVDVGCYYGEFSISEARGEALHLLSPDASVVSDTIYPANLDFDAGSELTACRVPDGTGPLTACRATPGAHNTAR